MFHPLSRFSLSLSHSQLFSCSLALLIVKTFNYNETNGEAKCLRRVVHWVRHSVRQCVGLSLCQPVHASVQLELASANYVSNVVGKSSVLLPLPPLIALRDLAKLTLGLRGRRGTINCKPWTLTWTTGEGTCWVDGNCCLSRLDSCDDYAAYEWY